MHSLEEIRVLKLKHLLDSCEESTANASKRKNIALIISVPVALLLCCIIFYLSKKYIKGRTSTSSGKILKQFNFLNCYNSYSLL